MGYCCQLALQSDVRVEEVANTELYGPGSEQSGKTGYAGLCSSVQGM